MNERRDEDRLLEHEYDGIREYDNPLPRWWVIILWVSVVWSVIYLANVIPGVGEGPGRAQNYENEMAAARERFGDPKAAAQAGAVDDSTVRAVLADAGRVAEGRQVFTTYCAACHREDLGGSIGPNLTDEYWLHGARPSQVHATVTNGVLDKGMPAWAGVLRPDQVTAVSAYVLSMQGTHPKDPKEPQGIKVEEDGERE